MTQHNLLYFIANDMLISPLESSNILFEIINKMYVNYEK